MSKEFSRRSFLRTCTTLLVMSGASSRALGRIVPTASYDGGEQTYVINVAEYQALSNIGGSVKLISEDQMNLNPDHIANRNPMKPPPRGRYPIAVTRVAESGPDAFKAVSTYCTHGMEYQLDDFNPSTKEFVCPHRGSSFTADGTHISKPETPQGCGDLRRFPTVFDESAGTITLTIPAA